MLRVFRIMRMVRLVKVSKGLSSLLQTLVLSLPSLANVGSILLLMFFVFGVLGMNLFGSATMPQGDYLNRHANFNSLGRAMLTLFRCSTGESWNGIMHDIMEFQPLWAPIYFVIFTILCFFMMVNLFIAVILENFEDIGNTDNGIGDDHMHTFKEEWENICGDYDNQLFMPSFELANLLNRMAPPLGFKGLADKWADQGASVYRHNLISEVRKLNMRRNGLGQIFFLDTLHAICSRFHEAMDQADPEDGLAEGEREGYQQYANDFVDNLALQAANKFKVIENVDPNDMRLFDLVPEFNSALALQKRWRGILAQRQMAKAGKKGKVSKASKKKTAKTPVANQGRTENADRKPNAKLHNKQKKPQALLADAAPPPAALVKEAPQPISTEDSAMVRRGHGGPSRSRKGSIII